MTDKQELREWWIDKDFPQDAYDEPQCSTDIHVIEKSAYDTLARRVKELEDSCETYCEINRSLRADSSQLAQANEVMSKMAEALNVGVTDEHGEKTHLGKYIDHKDCDCIREALAEYDKFKQGSGKP